MSAPGLGTSFGDDPTRITPVTPGRRPEPVQRPPANRKKSDARRRKEKREKDPKKGESDSSDGPTGKKVDIRA